jgi:hypothetical protein
MAELRSIDPAGDILKKVRRIMGRAVRNQLAAHGDDLAGFCLVSWDRRGEPCSAYLTSEGPVSRGLLPTYTHDVLQRHLSVTLAHECETAPIKGDA